MMSYPSKRIDAVRLSALGFHVRRVHILFPAIPLCHLPHVGVSDRLLQVYTVGIEIRCYAKSCVFDP